MVPSNAEDHESPRKRAAAPSTGNPALEKQDKGQETAMATAQAAGLASGQSAGATSSTSALNPFTISNWIRSSHPSQTSQANLLDRIARLPGGMPASSLHSMSLPAGLTGEGDAMARLLLGAQGSSNDARLLAALQNSSDPHSASNASRMQDLLLQLQQPNNQSVLDALAANIQLAEASVAQTIEERVRQLQQQAAYRNSAALTQSLPGLGPLSASQGLQNLGVAGSLAEQNLLQQLQQRNPSNLMASLLTQNLSSPNASTAQPMGVSRAAAAGSDLSSLLLQQQQQQHQVTQLQLQLLLDSAARSSGTADSAATTAIPNDVLLALLRARTAAPSDPSGEQDQKESP